MLKLPRFVVHLLYNKWMMATLAFDVLYNNTRLTAFFQNNFGKPVPEG